MPGIKSESFVAGRDRRWLGSSHGIDHAQTCVMTVASFDSVKTADGYIPSGTLLNVADRSNVQLYTGTGELAFLVDDIVPNGDAKMPVAAMHHGIVKTNLLPSQANLPASAPNGFVFIKTEEVR